jgi:hypothetical protein
LRLAEGAVLLNGVKALVAKVGGTEALKIIAKETAMSIKDAGAFVNDLVRGRGFGNVKTNTENKEILTYFHIYFLTVDIIVIIRQ